MFVGQLRHQLSFKRLPPTPNTFFPSEYDVDPLLKKEVLWMDEILHHLRNPGMMIPLYIPMNHGFPWFPSGAGFRPSTVFTMEHRSVFSTIP